MFEDVLVMLRSDPVACDVLVALFVSAANSYRFDSVLSPFPPTLCNVGNHGEKDIDSLVSNTNYCYYVYVYVPRLKMCILLCFRGKSSHHCHRSG